MATAAATSIENATVLWGPHLEPMEATTVVLAGGRVMAAGDAAPSGAESVDASGLLLMPGFVDAHVHIGFADPAEVLRRGVTTVRDLGWPPDEIFPLAGASRSRDFDGPLVLAVGPILTAPGGYPTRAAWAPPGTGREVGSAADVRAAVGEVAATGASAVKLALNPPVGPVFDGDVLTAIVTAAHERELKTTVHVYGLAELDKAIDCGVDELAHMLLSEEELPDPTIARMVAAGTTIVPTLSVRFGGDRELAVSNLARFRAAGGRVVYGTDLGNEGPGPGIDRAEVTAMAAAGFAPVDIVRAATVDAARHLGLTSKGLLDAGADADVVAVPVEALEDPASLCDVRMVWREGRRVL